MQVVALPLMEMDREVVLADELGQPAGGGDAARGQRREAGGVDAAQLAGLGDQLAVAVDHEDTLGIRVAHQPLDHRQDPAVVLVVHHELRVAHPQMPR